MQKVRRTGGARAGGFPGADRILADFADGTARRRVGLKPEGQAHPFVAACRSLPMPTARPPSATVTSGGFGPSVDGPVAMGYVDQEHTAVGTRLYAEVRGKYLAVAVAALPFITPTYKR